MDCQLAGMMAARWGREQAALLVVLLEFVKVACLVCKLVELKVVWTVYEWVAGKDA